jgi:hypothetical protein
MPQSRILRAINHESKPQDVTRAIQSLLFHAANGLQHPDCISSISKILGVDVPELAESIPAQREPVRLGDNFGSFLDQLFGPVADVPTLDDILDTPEDLLAEVAGPADLFAPNVEPIKPPVVEPGSVVEALVQSEDVQLLDSVAYALTSALDKILASRK